ncbi:MAG: type II toxin-antitoxin system RelE/ParE family toxin [Bdellovibrionales bacterium]|nr:type II toxin-antitoxin system RelE/ParE family toxin [Bdellovibrionales bacterium]
MIESIKGKTTQDIFDGVNSKVARKVPKELHERARDLLDALNAITKVDDLKTPPSNRLHKLKGDLKEFWSVSINNQWRIIFKWDGSNAIDVEITDYHN